jgi:hypothetical protein
MQTRLIYNAQDEIDASLTQGYLDSHGVEAYTGGATVPIGWMFNEGAAARLPQGVYVQEKDAKKAKHLLAMRGGSSPKRGVAKRANRAFLVTLAVFLAVLTLVLVIRM